MTAPTATKTPPVVELPDLWFPTGDAPGADTDIYGQDIAAAAEQENLAQAAIVAAAMVEVIELFPLLDFDDLDGSSRQWVNRTTEAVMRAQTKSFDRAVLDYDRFRAMRLGDQAAPREALATPLPTTPTRRATPTRLTSPTRSGTGRTQVPGSLTQGPSAPLPQRGPGASVPSPLPSGLAAQLRAQERRRPAATPKVDLSLLPPERAAAASSPVVRPSRDAPFSERIVREILTSAGPANVKHKTMGLAARPTYSFNADKWMERLKNPILVTVMGAASKQVVNGQRAAKDGLRANDKTALAYQRVVRSANPCAFCVMLASRGPEYRSERSAETVVNANAKRAVGEPYHDNCWCTSKAVYSENEPWAGDNLAYRLEWEKYAAGHERKEALRRFRRYLEGRDLTDGRSLRPRTPQAGGQGQGASPEAEPVE